MDKIKFPSINKTENVVYTYNGILFNFKKGENSATCKSVD